MTTRSKGLIAKTVSVNNLTNSLIASAFKLYQNYYDDVSIETFRRDLDKKDKIILIFDGKEGTLRGFSSLYYTKIDSGNRKVRVIYSGDTIIDERYRGTRALTREFFKNIVKERLKHPLTPVWWYLISKGYKTYLLLANNYNHYYPRFDRETPKHYQDLLDRVSIHFFGDNYNSQTGVISFSGGHEKLKDFAAPISQKMREEFPRIKFFEAKNPNWSQGEELACLGEVNWSLLVTYPLKLTKKFFIKRFQALGQLVS